MMIGFERITMAKASRVASAMMSAQETRLAPPQDNSTLLLTRSIKSRTNLMSSLVVESSSVFAPDGILFIKTEASH